MKAGSGMDMFPSIYIIHALDVAYSHACNTIRGISLIEFFSRGNEIAVTVHLSYRYADTLHFNAVRL
jgi:hypothetical protein